MSNELAYLIGLPCGALVAMLIARVVEKKRDAKWTRDLHDAQATDRREMLRRWQS